MPPPLDPPPSNASGATIARGAQLYGQYCVQCHGNRIGTFPDLRTSPTLHSQALFDATVLEGIRAQNGMVAFAEELSASDSEAIREYIVTLAVTARAAEDAAAARAAATAEPHAQ